MGTPEDVAGTVIWLSSRAGAYINGVTVPIDGGISMVNS
ncbi:SDR family oxidoreductase [Acidimicrobiales bacterium]|nr:SDR family oxidoreductase [Acidimicrobiales bacterium]